MVVVVAVAVTMVIATIVMSTSLGPRVVIPGPLSAQHALLTEDCSNCHSAEMDSAKGVLHGIVNSELSLRDSGLCLDCHDLGADPLQAHALEPGALGRLVADAAERAESADRVSTGGVLALSAGKPPHSDRGEYACAVCHVEHEGRRNELASMTDSQCQSCHQARFASFDNGHPGFDGYPYRRRLRIAFDHGSHIYHDFLTNEPGQAPTSCTDCHGVDASGDFMLTAPFERACASCHEKDVRATARSGGSGIAFFSLPAIDTMTLDDAGIGIGQWPADSGVAEGGITPFVRLMLAGDPALAGDLRTIGALDLLDLQGATGEQLAAVSRVAWGIKALALELSLGGHEAIARRIRVAVGGAASAPALSPLLAGGLTRSLLRESFNAWLPGLAAEMSRHGSGAVLATDLLEDAELTEIDAPGQAWSSLGGWYRDDMAFAIKYRPTGHGDAFLRAWADLAAGSPGAGSPVLGAFSGRDAVGQCLKCHSVDGGSPGGQGDGPLRINWFASRPADVSGSLTRFSHAPHLPLLGEDGCLRCHKVEPQTRDFELSYRQHDPSVFVSAMASMSQTECAGCHTPKKVASSCLDCHVYHEHRPTTRLRAGAPLKPVSEPAPQPGTDAGDDPDPAE